MTLPHLDVVTYYVTSFRYKKFKSFQPVGELY